MFANKMTCLTTALILTNNLNNVLTTLTSVEKYQKKIEILIFICHLLRNRDFAFSKKLNNISFMTGFFCCTMKDLSLFTIINPSLR